MDTTSGATPVVSSAAAVLVEVGHKGATSLSTGFTTNRAGEADQIISNAEKIYNAERADTIKAALMAGADRVTHNSTTANIADYRIAGHQTLNGLDDRFGAGQVNIFTSYQIIAGGEHDKLVNGSVDISCSAGTVLCGGFDHVDGFGGFDSSPTENRYIIFTGTQSWLLSAALVWNVQVADDFKTVTLNNLDLQLTDANGSVLFSSASTFDNTENMWLTLAGNNTYTLSVFARGIAPYSQSYALAWHLSAVPLPATIWLFAPALGILSFRRKRFSST
jgi:hypothetical protein